MPQLTLHYGASEESNARRERPVSGEGKIAVLQRGMPGGHKNIGLANLYQ